MAKAGEWSGNLLVFCALLFLSPDSPLGQTTTAVTRDPNAVALAGRALQPLAGSMTVIDITLEGTAAYVANERREWAGLGPKKEVSG